MSDPISTLKTQADLYERAVFETHFGCDLLKALPHSQTRTEFWKLWEEACVHLKDANCSVVTLDHLLRGGEMPKEGP